MSTTYEKRTDIHRPSAPEFDPEKYELRGVFDLNPDTLYGGAEQRARMEAVNRALKQGYSFAGAPHGSGQCSHCGAHIRYAALMAHRESNTILYVGETCLENRFMDLTKDEFQRLRKAAKLNAERRALAEKRAEFIADHPELVWASYAENIAQAGATVVWTYGWAEDTWATEEEAQAALDAEKARKPYLSASVYRQSKPGTSWMDKTRMGEKITVLEDMWTRFQTYGDMSDKAYNYLVKIVGWLSEAEDRLAQHEAKNAEAVAEGVQVPEGKVTVEGEIVSTKWRETMYGMTLKMLVKSDEGWKVWGTVPKALHRGNEDALKGQRVRFQATVKRSEDDVLFGFFSRPTQAQMV